MVTQRAPSTGVAVIYSLLVIIITLSGHLTNAQDPEIVIDSIYTLVIPQRILNQFYRCLCDINIDTCSLDYDQEPTDDNYYRYLVKELDEPETSSASIPWSTNGSFYCDPGSLASSDGEITCSRSHALNAACASGYSGCQSFSVSTTHTSCDINCVTLQWRRNDIHFQNFRNDAEPKLGRCGAVPPATSIFTTTPPGVYVDTTPPVIYPTLTNHDTNSNTVDPQTNNARDENTDNENVDGDTDDNTNEENGNNPGDPMRKEGGGGGDNSAALGAGIGVAALAVVAFAIAFFLWRRYRRRGAESSHKAGPLESVSAAKTNNTYDTPTQYKEGHAYTRGGGAPVPGRGGEYNLAFVDGSQSEFSGYLEPDSNIYAYIADDDVTSVTYANGSVRGVGNPHAAVPEYLTLTDDVSGQAGSSDGQYHVAKGIPTTASNVLSSGGKGTSSNIRIPPPSLGKPGKPKGGPATGGLPDPAAEYHRLFGGRSGKGEAVSRSFLAQYNNPPVPTDSEELEYEIYDDDDDDENKAESPSHKQNQHHAHTSGIPPSKTQNPTAPSASGGYTSQGQSNLNHHPYHVTTGEVTSAAGLPHNNPQGQGDVVNQGQTQTRDDAYTIATAPSRDSDGYSYSSSTYNKTPQYFELES